MTRESFDPIEEVERRIATGAVSRDAVEQARAFWRGQLRDGIVMPNGERVLISEGDLHHALLDSRILRKPERLLRLLEHVFEIRTAEADRRLGLSQWIEEGVTISGYAIIDENHHLQTMHVFNERGLKKKAKRGTVLWKRGA